MVRKSLLVTISIMFVLSLALMGCGKDSVEETNQNNNTEEGQLLIYTSMYPLYDFATKIAGEKAKVVNLVPAGAEPHDFEPTPKDIVELSKADLFIYNGGGFETWIGKIVEAVQQSNPEMVILETTANLSLLRAEDTGLDAHGHDHEQGTEAEEHGDHEHESKEEGHDHDHEHGTKEEEHEHEHEEGKTEDEHGHDEHGAEEESHHDHGEFDPHVWLDPVLAKDQALAIKNALVALDPENAHYYEDNYTALAQRFDELDAKFKDVADHITRKDFIVSHAAFGYLAHRYQFNQISISGLSPSVEPSTKALKDIIEFARQNQIEYIMFENLVTPKVAEVVRQEIQAEALVLYTIEGITKEDQSQGKDYFALMEENLKAFKQALGYKK